MGKVEAFHAIHRAALSAPGLFGDMEGAGDIV
jgi:hypothetical protein